MDTDFQRPMSELVEREMPWTTTFFMGIRAVAMFEVAMIGAAPGAPPLLACIESYQKQMTRLEKYDPGEGVDPLPTGGQVGVELGKGLDANAIVLNYRYFFMISSRERAG